MTLTSIGDIITQKEKAKLDAHNSFVSRRPYVSREALEFQYFAYLMKHNAEIWMLKDNDPSDFVFDKFTLPIIQQLYLHLTKTPQIGKVKFAGDMNKGIWLWGNSGTGKSILAQAYASTIYDLTGKNIHRFLCVQIGDVVRDKDKGYDYFMRNMLLDDVGREERNVINYGNDTVPMMDIMFRVEKKGYFLLATSNQPIDYFKKVYGTATVRRFHGALNEFELKGTDRTPKN